MTTDSLLRRSPTSTTMKEIAASTSTPPSEILTSLKRNSSAAAQLQIPEKPSWKHSIYYVRQSENTTPPAPTSLADLTLVPEDILSFNNEEMLIFDNKSTDARIIIFGTQKNLDILLRCGNVHGTVRHGLQHPEGDVWRRTTT